MLVHVKDVDEGQRFCIFFTANFDSSKYYLKEILLSENCSRVENSRRA